MIERYTLPEMGKIWEDENRFKKMLDVEILACEALSNLGKIPKDSLIKIKKGARLDIKEIKEIEEKTKHDVMAFVESIASKVGDAGRFIHMGLTSSDVLDTSLAVMMKEAADILNVSLAAAKSRLHRGRLFLRGKLDHYFWERIGRVG